MNDSTKPDWNISRRELLALALGSVSAATMAQESTDSGISNERWSELRGQLNLNPRWAYFDTAGAGPATRAVLASEYRALESLHADEQEFYAARYNGLAVQQLCSRVASWLNCSRDEVTLTRGSEAGLEQFANWFNFQPTLQSGDELVLCNQLPTTLIAFWTRWARQHGLSVKTVMLPSPLHGTQQIVEAFAGALDDRSRIVLFSHVQPGDGAILPVRELCQLARNHRVMSVVDGRLMLGAMTVSVADLGCDVYASSFCHWLNGPRHAGVLYVRKELHTQLPFLNDAIIETLDLNTSSWPSLIARMPQDFVQYAPQFQALPAALSLQENIGKSVISARIRELSSYARLQLQSANLQVITPVPGELWNQVLVVNCNDRNAAEIVNYLRRTDQLIIGRTRTVSNSTLRLSFHIYNSFEDIDRLLRGLTRVLKGQS
jgi:isopenicillin-N epimerase